MTKKLVSQNNFNAGELSPRVYARSDVDQYKNGVETATNFKLLPHGPAQRRNGTQFIREIKTSSSEVRLVRFQFSADDALILEFGNTYIRFFTDKAVIGAPLEVTTPYSASDVQDLQYVQFGDKLYLAHPDYEPRVLTRISNTSWTLKTLNALPEPTVEIGELPSTTVTPAATTGLGVTFTAGAAGTFLDADVGRQIVNLSSGETGRASITAVAAGGDTATCDIVEDFTDTNAIASGDWKMDLSPIADLTPTGTKVGSIIQLDADVLDSTTALETFRSTDVGRYILIHDGVCQITAVNSSSQVDAEVLKSLSALTETDVWSLEDPAWSASRGYPRAVGFFEQRLIFGGTTEQPQTIWMSETGIFDGFGVGSGDSDGIEIELASNDANQIQWIASGRELVVGTSGSEVTVGTGGLAGAITSSNIQARPRTYHGSKTQQPINIRNEIVFIDRSARNILSFLYDFESDGFLGEELTFLAEHITTGGIVEAVYVQEPDSQIYAVRNDGKMIVGTYDRKQKVLGWSLFEDASGTYEHVATISDGGVDQVWVVVNRTINGATKRYIEVFDTTDGTDPVHGFADSFLTLSDNKAISGITKASPGVVTTGSAHGFSNGDAIKIKDVVGMTEVNNKVYYVANKTSTTFELTDSDGNNIDTSAFTTYASGGNAFAMVNTLSGLDHLEGETVQVKCDNAAHPDKTVSSGAITLDYSTAEAMVGLEYTSTLKTLKKEYNIGMGTMQGQRSRYVRPILRVYKSAIPNLNSNFLPIRIPSDMMDEAPGLVSGDLEYGPTSWDNTGQVTFSYNEPFPVLILGIFGAIDGGIK